LGSALAGRIVAAVELGRRTLVRPAPERPQFLTARAAAEFLLPRYGVHPVEQFGVVLLDTRQRLIKVQVISVGSVDASVAHPREVFREATMTGASMVIAFHNHRDPRRHDVLFAEGIEVLVMSRVLYLDCFSGAAGDMMLGALIDVGVPVEALREALGTLGVGHRLETSRVVRAGIAATKVDVLAREEQASGSAHDGHHHAHDDAAHHHHYDHRSLADIRVRIEQSALSAEEVGAVDSIIDIVGSVFALEWLGIDDVVASPLNLGSGTVEMAHGTFPVPAPATLRLLTGVPVYSSGIEAELVTPTGALLVSDYAREYGPMPKMAIDRVGYGAGTRDLTPTPNVLRAVVGTRSTTVTEPGGEPILKIECEIDDMNPQLFGPLMDRLFGAGAADVFLTAVQMKKGRPGTLVTVLVREDLRPQIAEILFRETTTIGFRFDRVWRETLDRRHEEVVIDGGKVRIKVAERGGEVLGAAPEFDDCVQVARRTGQPVKQVQAAALQAWFRGNGTG
jgi:uncharacterized protein (TIGR00299 family) protein